MNEAAKPKRRHLNAAERRAHEAADTMKFIQQYERKAHKGFDPNDRTYSRDFERLMQRMGPIELDALMRDDED